MKVTVGIKALNEERHIAASLASAVAAVAPFDGEVVLADCLSTDRTVEIARGFPAVRVVQLADPADRSCGAGAQLAFQQARGEYFYLLDGDMMLDPAFLAKGIAFLEANPKHAAVGGRVREANTESIEFELRARNDRVNGSSITGDVDRLDCGGLYRADAVREASYFADRNLHAFEEFELGARLRSRGWRLARIDAQAVDHHGHSTGGYRLIWKRIRSGYAGAPGEVIRAAIGQRHWKQVLRSFSQLRNGGAVIVWWLLLLGCLFTGHWIALAVLLAAPLAFLTWRRGSLSFGAYSLVTWNMIAWGLVSGITRSRVPPERPLPAVELGEISGAGEAKP